MNRSFRFVSILFLFASAMFAFTSSAYAAQPMARSPLAFSSRQSTSRTTSPASNVVRYKNGTTVTNSSGSRVIQPYGRHAQPMVQHRDAKGRWMTAGASKVWGVRTWASSKKK